MSYQDNQLKIPATKSMKITKILLFICITFSFSCRFSKQNEFKPWTKVNTLTGLDKKIGEPFGIAVKEDVIYISDGENGKIWKISEDSKAEVLTDKLNTPSQIAFDKNGDLIVADSGTNTIRKVRQNGDVELVAGVENERGSLNGEAAKALFDAPIGVAVLDEKIFVADTYNDEIRLIENGKVSTYAGSRQGFSDGKNARFDTPLGLAVWTDGRILVADSGNQRIRVIEQSGEVWTLSGNGKSNLTDGLLSEAEFVQPTALCVDKFGSIYVADGNVIRVIGRRFIPVVETISNDKSGFADGKLKDSRFNRPSGLAFDETGNLFVADADNQLVRVFTGNEIGKTISVEEFDEAGISPEQFRESGESRWTYEPFDSVRDIAGTLGEVRGKIVDENSIARFHNGLDVAGSYGEKAYFIRDEKVLRPTAAQFFETVRELIRLPTIGYIHIRLGRDAEQIPFDDERFQFLYDEDEKPIDVRVPRGTKFAAGEAIGTLNRFNHVHLIAGRTGSEMNALDALVLPKVADSREPTIQEVKLYDKNWREIEIQDDEKIIKLKGKIRIVVQAFDQMDGNADRRKLGVYKVGYQILDENKEPLKDFEEPKWTIEFKRTPADEAAVLVYAKGSQSGATGETIFRYIATNEVSGRIMREGFLDADQLKLGKYFVKVSVADYFDNIASEDIEFEVE